jgi:aspartyl-tRNA(Asn)/glutamyl-tRNA(Gln) amidotransferase subunit B
MAVESAHLVSGEIMRLMNSANILPENLNIDENLSIDAASDQDRFKYIDTNKLAALIGFIISGKINRASYKETVEAVFISNADPESYIAEKGLMMVSDDTAVIAAVDKIIEANKSSVEDYRAGKEKVFGFLMGMAMKELGKGGNPELVKKVLLEKLSK